MTSLGETVAALSRLRKGVDRSVPVGDDVLREVAAFGPNPGALRMLLHTPAKLAKDAPLVVALHGCAQTAHEHASGAGWLTLADRFGFAVLCPEQTRANNANLCFNWYQPGDATRGKGETASIRQMVRHALDAYSLDASRVFVTGLSAGGAMTAAMLAAYPEVFAGGAVIAGLPYGAADGLQEALAAMFGPNSRSGKEWGDRVRSASRHKAAWPTISIWHGDADHTVRPGASDDLVAQWTDVHGARAGKAATRRTDGGRYQAWAGPDGRTAVELHRIPGMGHGTPLKSGGDEGCGTPGPYMLEVGTSSSLEIAASWGIATVRHAARTTAKAKPADPRPAGLAAGLIDLARFRPAASRAAPAIDVGEVIAKALRSAGLTK